MHPDASKELGELCEAVEKGVMPVSALPRLFYLGHEVIREWEEYPPDGKPVMRCMSCLKHTTLEKDDDVRVCKYCPDKRNCWGHPIVNAIHHVVWRCKDCKHEWEAQDGRKCPSCGLEKS